MPLFDVDNSASCSGFRFYEFGRFFPDAVLSRYVDFVTSCHVTVYLTKQAVPQTDSFMGSSDQWSFRKTGTAGTLASRAEIDV